MSRPKDLARAEKIALAIFRQTGVAGLFLFGGVAKFGCSKHDIDLVVVVNQETFSKYIQALGRILPARFSGGSTGIAPGRSTAFRTLFPNTVAVFSDASKSWLEQIHPDILVFPVDWETRVDELSTIYGSTDPRFVRNVVLSMVPFDQNTARFQINPFVAIWGEQAFWLKTKWVKLAYHLRSIKRFGFSHWWRIGRKLSSTLT